MNNLTMQQYLSQVKNIVDNIAAAGSKIDPEDIVLYILKGLPSTYNSFKTTVRTSPLPADLDNLYSLLCSEEIHVNQEIQKDQSTSSATALYTTSSNQSRGRPQRRTNRNKNTQFPMLPSATQSTTLVSPQNQCPTCQICGKTGHSALNCWHIYTQKYAPAPAPKALLAQPSPYGNQDWVLDTGATTHLTPNMNQLQQSYPYSCQESVSIANGSTLPIQNSGQGILSLPDTPRKLRLRNILHVPSLTHNLLSVSKLISDNSISITFNTNGFEIKDSLDNHLLLRGHLHKGLYHIQQAPEKQHVALQANTDTSQTWHARLGHPNNKLLPTIARLIPECKNLNFSSFCKSCTVAKSHKLPFNKRITESTTPFELIHSDVWGPAQQISLDGFRYYVIFIDDYTHFSWIYFMHSKHETFLKFQVFCSLIRTQFSTTPKIFRSDGGGEFISTVFQTFLQTNGIIHQRSCPHTPEQNGLAERKHRHLLDLTRTLLHAAALPNLFWAEATATANYLINRLPSTSLKQQSPYQKLYNKIPNYTHLRTFGCLCYPWLQPYTTSKFSPRSSDCLFIGYSPNHKGYKCYNLQTKKTQISRHVIFKENVFPYTSIISENISHHTPPNTNTSPLLLIPTSCTSRTTKPMVTPPTNHQICPEPSQTQLPFTVTQPTNTNNNTTTPDKPTNTVHHMTTRSKYGISKPKH
ncbi:Retrovirus-related Pol polyprotein from transposon TNT 1-94 [Dendrobium catenatum]|uniref:Retrovirus-related Pol polyprotein from transposon TNT 1-94 n=1 Tax=Dendrobium catenatum TaxID=906689 RepID=A0A2I0WCG7_9ASPA|nr:Retrovirus-related Pol polyprotein from transposon TNT 1-94 [Dendrobium catenatum]